MSYISWSSEYATDISQVDSQHQKLIGIINTLHEAMECGQAGFAIFVILNELADYTNFHFVLEESLMLRHNYEFYETHKKEHDFFITKVKEYQYKSHYGKDSISIEVINFLREWLLHHILESDKMITAYLKSKGVK